MFPNLDNKGYQDFVVVLVILLSLIDIRSAFFLNPEIISRYEKEFYALFSSQGIRLYILITLILLAALLAVVNLCFKRPTPIRNITK